MIALAGILLFRAAAPQPVDASDWVRPGDLIFSGSDSHAPGTVYVPEAAPLRRSHSDVVAAHAAEGITIETEKPATQTSGWLSTATGWNNQPPAQRTVPAGQYGRPYGWHVLPTGLMYHSYLAGEKEPRIGLSILSDKTRGMVWDAALGGRVGLIRYGTAGGVNPEGWQIDLEGAALARVDPEVTSTALEATDYRFGLVWTRRQGPNRLKIGYSHISSHVGDEFLQNNVGFVRLNYVRDSVLIGVTRDVTVDTQVYGEVAYAMGAEGGAEPLELQFGAQYNPFLDTCRRGAPFAAINFHLREEFGFGGAVNAMAGWRWRGADNGRLLRVGLQYYNGKSMQWSFINRDEQMLGGGIWFDY
ncbi:MAG: DUF1207 domain-containing protein [Planctomycetota bacterium]|nr:MAG: DUF1207 domain-containing protein [Planctomycetota bacterium]REJ91166.1 MAG: DUF1207 domain-containing protein [Planctomycetota bacterium]REK20356.1 MAG: DUF1207 domain-containing protein [Planctomycetota bacterium]REK26853.1 MAG: DUF1207 domain-containing protein [Planctomycetota bacterium]